MGSGHNISEVKKKGRQVKPAAPIESPLRIVLRVDGVNYLNSGGNDGLTGADLSAPTGGYCLGIIPVSIV